MHRSDYLCHTPECMYSSLCERFKSLPWWSIPCVRVHPSMLMTVLTDIRWIQLVTKRCLQNVMSNPLNAWRFIFISFGDLSPRLWSRCLTLCIFFLTFNAFLLFRHALVCSASFHPMKPHVALHNYDAKPNAGTPDPSRVTCPMRVSRRNGFVFLHSWIWWHFVMMLIRMRACITDPKQRTSMSDCACV